MRTTQCDEEKSYEEDFDEEESYDESAQSYDEERDDEESYGEGPEVLKEEKAVLLQWALYKEAVMGGESGVATNRLVKLTSLITKSYRYFCYHLWFRKRQSGSQFRVDLMAAVANGKAADYNLVVPDG